MSTAKKKIDLRALSERARNDVVNEAIARMQRFKFQRGTTPTYGGSGGLARGWIKPGGDFILSLPAYATSATAVLPLLHARPESCELQKNEAGVWMCSRSEEHTSELQSPMY